VFDTNVFARALKSRSKESPNKRVLRLWLIQKRLHLIVSDEVVAEYLETFDEILELERPTLGAWQVRFRDRSRVEIVGLARRFEDSRDPDDNLMLATALAGNADFLLTNDRDLLDLPEEVTSKLPFRVLTPAAFLKEFAEG